MICRTTATTPTCVSDGDAIKLAAILKGSGADDESLFGYVTGLSADERPRFGIPAEQLPRYVKKPKGKKGNDGQLAFNIDELE